MGVVRKIKKMTIVILVACLGFFISSCSPEKEISTIEEVDLSQELKVIEAFGLVKAEESKDVIIDFPAVVQEVLVNEGQKLSLNDPILTLDLSQYQSQISDKNNELNIAKLEYQRVIKILQGLSQENKEIEINKLENDLEYSKKLFVQVAEDHNSKQKLYEVGAISQETQNQSNRSLDEAKKSVDAIDYELQLASSENKRSIEQLRIQQGIERDQLNIQSERILLIENNLLDLKDKLNKSYIIGNQIVSDYKTATIHDITYATGHMIDTSRKAFSIINLDSLIIEANVVEEFIRDIKVGAPVRIVPIADRAREYKGSVVYISQMAFPDNGETVIPVRITIDNIDSFLLPNYNVDVFIDVQ